MSTIIEEAEKEISPQPFDVQKCSSFYKK